MDTEDRLLLEVDVFLSKALAENLVVLQYPVRPGNREWNDLKIKNASIKPKNQMLRLEVALDTYSDKYCPSKGEQIAINTDGAQESTWHVKEKDKSLYFKQGMMDKIVLESSTPCVDTKTYAVAILQDKELHITPIKVDKGVLQMRPSYSYFDKQDKLKHDKDDDNSDEEDKEPEATQVTVKFTRQETEMAKKVREKSFATISERVSSEPWYDALWKHAETDHAELERLKLFSATSSDGAGLTLPPLEYVRALVPPPPDDEADSASAAVLFRPVEQQLTEILLNAKLMQFNDLRAMIRTERGDAISEAALVSELSGCACCVRGVWTARSSALYSRAGAVPPPVLAAVRDHVLYLFTKHTYIDRRKVAAAAKVPPSYVLEIISSVAKFDARTGWELLIPPDTAFEAKFPDVIKRQNLYWEAKHKQFLEMRIGEAPPKRQRKKSQRDSVSSDTMLSPKPRCKSVSVSEEDSDKKKKNKSASGVGKRTRHSSSSAQDT